MVLCSRMLRKYFRAEAEWQNLQTECMLKENPQCNWSYGSDRVELPCDGEWCKGTLFLLETVWQTLWCKEVEHEGKVKHLRREKVAIFISFTVQMVFNKCYCQQQIIKIPSKLNFVLHMHAWLQLTLALLNILIDILGLPAFSPLADVP